MDYNLVTVLGATATGKTKLAVDLARLLNGEIISADSRQVYRGMDLGTGKDLAEYGSISYHLIDIVEPGYEFNLFEYKKWFDDAFQAIQSRQKLPIMCGGTGLYLEAVIKDYHLVEAPENVELRKQLQNMSDEDLALMLKELKPEQHNTTDIVTRKRLIKAIEIARATEELVEMPTPLPSPVNPLIFGISWPRGDLRKRITQRLKMRLNEGMIDEVKGLLENGVSSEMLDHYGLEYRFINQYLQGEYRFNDLFQKLNSAIHQFAKRQETWFRRMERNGVEIIWLEGIRDPLGQAMAVISKL